MLYQFFTALLFIFMQVTSIGAMPYGDNNEIVHFEDPVSNIKSAFAELDWQSDYSQQVSASYTQKKITVDNVQKILVLYDKLHAILDVNFVCQLPAPEARLLEGAQKQRNEIKSEILEAILSNDVEKFQKSLNEYISLTEKYLDKQISLCSVKELQEIEHIAEATIMRLMKIKNYLESFSQFSWLARHRATSNMLLVLSAMSWFTFINGLVCYVMKYLVTSNIISPLTEISIYAVVNFLIILDVAFLMCIVPMKFLCCKKNSNAARIFSKEIESMIDFTDLKMAGLFKTMSNAIGLRQMRYVESFHPVSPEDLSEEVLNED